MEIPTFESWAIAHRGLTLGDVKALSAARRDELVAEYNSYLNGPLLQAAGGMPPLRTKPEDGQVEWGPK